MIADLGKGGEDEGLGGPNSDLSMAVIRTEGLPDEATSSKGGV